MDYLKPSEVVDALVEAGARKAKLPVLDLLVRGALSGAILGIATSLAITATIQTGAPIVGALIFPVGFVMISDEVEGPGYIAQYLWRLLVDERYQRRGYGTAALDLVAAYFRGRPGVEMMWTSAGRGEGSPIPFYERDGFERTGDIVFDEEILLRLRL